MATSSRDERRRRILERGSDRLALITGRLQTLASLPSPATPAPSPSSFAALGSSSDSVPQIHANVKDNADCNRKLPQLDIGDIVAPENGFDRSKLEAQPRAIDKKAETCLVTAPAEQPFPNVEPHNSDSSSYQPYCFSSKEINHCILASEGTRFMCAVVIALLVVQSYTSSPMLSRKSIIASRPLYIVLLTDVTIVLGLLLLEKHQGGGNEDNLRAVVDDGHVWAGAVKVLERGLVVHQTVRAVFIDCSVYLVIVICGLSLMQRFQLQQ